MIINFVNWLSNTKNSSILARLFKLLTLYYLVMVAGVLRYVVLGFIPLLFPKTNALFRWWAGYKWIEEEGGNWKQIDSISDDCIFPIKIEEYKKPLFHILWSKTPQIIDYDNPY